MTCMSKDAKFHKNVESEKGTIISGLWSLLEQIQWLLGGVGHCYAWHVRVPFGNVLFLISSNRWFVHLSQKTLKKGKISCLFSHPFHIFLFFLSYPSFLTIHSPIHPIFFLSFFIFKLLHTLPIVASCLCILTVSW